MGNQRNEQPNRNRFHPKASKMTVLQDLGNPEELKSFVSTNSTCLVTFSAHWCGPCRASRPQLETLAKQAPVPFGYVYESDLGDYLHTFRVRAFPTYIMFVGGHEIERVEGVNFAGIQNMVSKHSQPETKMPVSGGSALGGESTPALSTAAAREQRLARLGKVAVTETVTVPATTSEVPVEETNDTEMTDANMEDSGHTNVAVESLDKSAIETLTGELGFSLLRAQKGLLFSSGTVESAVEWLMEHQDDPDIDHPIPDGAGSQAQSYKCNECGKILSNLANLELHANKTGHSDFEESTHRVKPLTAEEKASKIAEIKALLKAKRAEREDAEKVDNIEREKQRRFMGKEMAKTREQMEEEQRKRDALARKREKEEYRKERARIRAELEKDKAERKANKGKLHSTLGVDGYNPSAIQYDDGMADASSPSKPKRAKADASKIEEYIAKVSSYRAGGDGAKCLKILKAYVGNVAENPSEEKFRLINTENKVYKTKIKPFIGAKQLLLAVGFSPKEGDITFLELKQGADVQLLKDTKEKLERAMAAF